MSKLQSDCLASRVRWNKWQSSLIAHGITVFLTLFGLFGLLSLNLEPVPARMTFKMTSDFYSPFRGGLKHFTQTTDESLWNLQQELYMGQPNDVSEDAWNALLRPNRTLGIRLSSEELERFDIKDSIHLSDGGYAVILAVHHNLHCLRRIRQTFYAEQYYPEWTEEDFAANRMHNLHCLESIRSSIICQPDLTPMPYYWSGNIRHEVNARPQSKRQCIDWDLFSKSLQNRQYSAKALIREP